MNTLSVAHAKVLYLRFCAIYGDKFAKSYHDDDFKSLWAAEWSSGLADINTDFIKDALDYCKKNMAWPPTISEFISICDKLSGIPSTNELIKLMINMQFNHPIVKLVYDKIGSFALKNDKEKDIVTKVNAIYSECLNSYRDNQNQLWAQLEDYNAKQKELPAPTKIPSTSESAAFRECMNKCQEILKGKKILSGGKTYKHFDENKIKKGHREFDQAVFDEYKAYLMSIPETETMILPPFYLMDRNKFLNMRDQSEWLRQQGYVPPNQREGFAKSYDKQENGKPTKFYKSWTNE
jgi:hypothetical protein